MGLSSGKGRVALALGLMVLAAGLVACNAPQTTINPRSDQADSIQGVYEIVFWLAMVVFVGVMVATLAFAILFRERPGRQALQIHGNARLEVLWTLIPVAIVVVIAVPTFDSLAQTTDDPPADAVQVEVVGHQWWFEFNYPDLGITTANELHLPVDRAANFSLLSADVIHSFWVPQLAGKVDLVPGHDNDLWFTPNTPGEYLGQCAEFCGDSHALMRFRVIVDTAEEFDAWAQRQAADGVAPTGDLEQQGQQLFLQNACVGCHTVAGTAAQGRVGPDLTHVGGRTRLAASIMDNTAGEMKRWIRNAPSIKPGIVMPAFPALSDDDLNAIVAYLQSLE